MAFVNRLLAVVVGFGLLALGTVVAAEAVLAAIGRPPALVDVPRVGSMLAGLSWTDRLVLNVALVLVVLGLVLLLLQCIPRPPAALPLNGRDHRSGQLDRRALARRLADLAGEDHQVTSASATVRRRAAKVTATTQSGADVAAVRQRVAGRVAALLEASDLARPVEPKVDVVPGGDA